MRDDDIDHIVLTEQEEFDDYMAELQFTQQGRPYMPKTSEMIVSKFLRKEDFEEDQILTIADCKLEPMQGNANETRWVLYFREMPKGMVLNTTSIRVLEQSYGDDSDMWINKKVTIYVDPNVSFQGRIVGGLRLRPIKPSKPINKAAKAQQPKEEEDLDDDIPF